MSDTVVSNSKSENAKQSRWVTFSKWVVIIIGLLFITPYSILFVSHREYGAAATCIAVYLVLVGGGYYHYRWLKEYRLVKTLNPQERIQLVMGLTDEDIGLNRNHRLSVNQIQKRRREIILPHLTSFVLILFLSTAFFLFARDARFIMFMFYIGLGGLLALSYILIAKRKIRRWQDEITNHKVESVSGSAKLFATGGGQSKITYHLVINGSYHFMLGSKIVDAFLDDENYTVYFLTESYTVIGAEWLAPETK